MEDLMDRNQREQEEFEKNQVILTPGQLVMKRFLRNKLACAGLGILICILIFCIAGPFFSPYGEYEIFYINTITKEEVSMTGQDVGAAYMAVNIKAPVSKKHLLGTDGDGRDVLTRLMYGGRISLFAGIGVVIIELAVGVVLGGIAGYYGGFIDMVIMRVVEIFYTIPFVPLMLIISAILVGAGIKPQHKVFFIIAVMGLLYWARVARIVRGQILAIREMEYMQAAEAQGLGIFRKLFKHLIPNTMPMIILIATMDVGSIILTESVLSFLGVGIAWPYASWGNMVDAVASSVIMRNYPNIWVPPGICILLTVLAFNFIGDGLRDAFDPKMKR